MDHNEELEMQRHLEAGHKAFGLDKYRQEVGAELRFWQKKCANARLMHSHAGVFEWAYWESEIEKSRAEAKKVEALYTRISEVLSLVNVFTQMSTDEQEERLSELHHSVKVLSQDVTSCMKAIAIHRGDDDGLYNLSQKWEEAKATVRKQNWLLSLLNGIHTAELNMQRKGS
jgi:hypothetical protein